MRIVSKEEPEIFQALPIKFDRKNTDEETLSFGEGSPIREVGKEPPSTNHFLNQHKEHGTELMDQTFSGSGNCGTHHQL